MRKTRDTNKTPPKAKNKHRKGMLHTYPNNHFYYELLLLTRHVVQIYRFDLYCRPFGEVCHKYSFILVQGANHCSGSSKHLNDTLCKRFCITLFMQLPVELCLFLIMEYRAKMLVRVYAYYFYYVSF